MCLECKYEPKCSTISHVFYIVRVSHIERMFCFKFKIQFILLQFCNIVNFETCQSFLY